MSSQSQQQAAMQQTQQSANATLQRPPTTQQPQQHKTTLPLPDDHTMQQAVKLSLKLTKPIDFYFYIESLKGKVSIESREGEKIIFKNDDEHTSPILNTYKSNSSYIIVTENTIYILSDKTQIKA